MTVSNQDEMRIGNSSIEDLEPQLQQLAQYNVL